MPSPALRRLERKLDKSARRAAYAGTASWPKWVGHLGDIPRQYAKELVGLSVPSPIRARRLA